MTVWPDMRDDLDVRLLPAAVSPLVAGALAAAPRRRRVLAAFPVCLYVSLGEHDRVLAVLAADALELPTGLRLTARSSDLDWGVHAGHDVVVGGGRVRLPGLEVVAARLSRPARVRPSAHRSGGQRDLPAAGVLGDLTHDLAAAALAGRPVGPAVRGLVGAGQGLTPSGDDALCGALLALGAVDADAARRAHAAVRSALVTVLERTTSLSASLLVAAADGYAVPAVTRLVALTAAGGSRADGVARALDAVLAIGHTSGRDIVAGLAGTLRALDAALPHTPPSMLPPTPHLPNAGPDPAPSPEEGPARA